MKPSCGLIGLVVAMLTWASVCGAMPPLSNAIARAEAAAELEERDQHVAALELYREAQRDVAGLVEQGVLDVDTGAALWREWEERTEQAAPQARAQLRRRLSGEYGAHRAAFLNALSSNDLGAMQVTLDAAERAYIGVQVLAPTGASEQVSLPPPGDMRSAYVKLSTEARQAWYDGLTLTSSQRSIVDALMANRSFDEHVAILDEAAAARTVKHLQWLERVYADLLEFAPLTFAYHFGLGNSRLLQGEIAGANRAWHDALDYYPDSLYVHYHLARTCGSSYAEATRAIAHLRWIREHSDSRTWHVRANLEIARRFMQRGDLDAAARHAAETALLARADLTQDTLNAYIEASKLRCAALLRRGDLATAMAAIEDAARTLPGRTDLTLEVADTYASLARAAEPPDLDSARAALRWYGRALATRATLPHVHAQRAYLYLLLGNLEQAEKEALAELGVDARSPDALSALGYVYLARGEQATARLFFTKALAMDSHNAPALTGLQKLDRLRAR